MWLTLDYTAMSYGAVISIKARTSYGSDVFTQVVHTIRIANKSEMVKLLKQLNLNPFQMPFAIIQVKRHIQVWQEDKSTTDEVDCYILIKKDFLAPNLAIRYRDQQDNKGQLIVIEYW